MSTVVRCSGPLWSTIMVARAQKARNEQQLELDVQAASAGLGEPLWQRWRNWWLADDTLLFDRVILWLALILIAFGLIMVASASVPVAERLTGNPFHFLLRHTFYVALGLDLLLIVVQIPIQWWYSGSAILMLISMVMLVMVLAIGHEVNGAKRWIKVGQIGRASCRARGES